MGLSFLHVHCGTKTHLHDGGNNAILLLFSIEIPVNS